jgi:hypothetical protein
VAAAVVVAAVAVVAAAEAAGNQLKDADRSHLLPVGAFLRSFVLFLHPG